MKQFRNGRPLTLAGLVCVIGFYGALGAETAPSAGITKSVFGDLSRAPAMERLVVPVNGGISTCKEFRHEKPAPWDRGNTMTIVQHRTLRAGEAAERTQWLIINMHAENLVEVARRLGISSIEVQVLHTGKSRAKVLEPGKPERQEVVDSGYALVTDRRIPRKWFLSKPLPTSLDKEVEARIRDGYSGFFRVAD